MKKLFGYTWMGWLNICILQWLFVRLYYTENDTSHIESYGILLPIVPLTGWYSNYLPSKHYHFDFKR